MGRPNIAHIITDDSASGGQIIDGSMKFNRIDSSQGDYLYRTPSSGGNRKVFTLSVWFKPIGFGSWRRIFAATPSGSVVSGIALRGDGNVDGIRLQMQYSGVNNHWTSTGKYRDPTGWYHLVVAVDLNASSGSRQKIYINGVRDVGSYVTGSEPSISREYQFNHTVEHRIGSSESYPTPFDGFMSQFYWIDGEQLPAERFGYTDDLTGIWRPKKFIATGPNNGTTWSSNATSSNFNSGSATNVFNGNVYNSSATITSSNASNNHFTLSSVNVVASKVGVVLSNSGSDIQVYVNGSLVGTAAGGDIINGTPKHFEFTFTETTVSTIKVQRVSSTSGWIIYGVSLNGVALLNGDTSNVGLNGFYLPLDGSSFLGRDQSGNNNHYILGKGNDSDIKTTICGSVPLEKATGALPILNTNSSGNTALPGFRPDPLKQYLFIAAPLSGDIRDFSHIIRGSGSQLTSTNQNTINMLDEANLYSMSRQYDGDDDYVQYGSQSAYDIGTGEFCIEGWWWANAITSSGYYKRLWNVGSGLSDSLCIDINYNNYNHEVRLNDVVILSSGSRHRFKIQDWMHVALCRTGTTLKLFVNGVEAGSTSSSHDLDFDDDTFRVGRNHDSNSNGNASSWNGYIQDFRFYKGTGKYTSDFLVPSTQPMVVPDVPSGVAVKRRYKDVMSTHGSLMMRGREVRDCIKVASHSDLHLSNHAFTIEGFFYFAGNRYDTPGSNGTRLFINGVSGASYLEFRYDWSTACFAITANNSDQATDIAYQLQQRRWYHIALTRNAGSAYKVYVDGIFVGGTNYAYAIQQQQWTIGGLDWADGYGIRGFISNFRVLVGTQLYSGTSYFTPPSKPLEVISDTKLLCCTTKDSVTSATVTPSTITAHGNAKAYSFNPFDSDYVDGEPGDYCTLNVRNRGANASIDDGGLEWSCSASGGGQMRGTLSFNSGKYYWESEAVITSRYHVGVAEADKKMLNADFGTQPYEWGVRTDAYGVHSMNVRGENVDQLDPYGTNVKGMIWGVAVDADNGKIYFSRDGIWLNNSNPETELNPVYSNLSGRLTPVMGRRTGANAAHINFGQRPFRFPPPIGFKALTKSNVEKSGIINPSKDFGIRTWTGNGGVQNITGLGFKPDLVWLKSRSHSKWYILVDSVRGMSSNVSSNSNADAFTETHIPSMHDDGWQVDDIDSGTANQSGMTYVGWAWKAGGAPTATNSASAGSVPTAGSVKIDGQNATSPLAGNKACNKMSVNTKAGFSIVHYTGTGNAMTLAHGLNSRPDVVFVKTLTGADADWIVYTKAFDGSNDFFILNTTAAKSDSGFAGTNSTVFNYDVGASTYSNTSGRDYIQYNWTSVPGYSKIGMYSGDGLSHTEGAYVHCGFRPAYILVKVSNAVERWYCFDSARDPHNPMYRYLYVEDNAVEDSGYTGGIVEFTSTGFKFVNGTGTFWNGGSQNYFYMAFAEQAQTPFGAQPNAR